MNIEIIRKLLISSNKEDNLLALNILRGRNPYNWRAFTIDLHNICHGYYYQRQYSLAEKYFISYSLDLLSSWYNLID